MQTLVERNTYTPTSASQARGNCDLELNKEAILSVQGLKTSSNILEVNQVQQAGRSLKANLLVFVISKNGIPLMPCGFAKSKRMVKSGKAVVLKRFPFTIQLNFECENQVQKVILGIDSGYQNVGFSATTEKQELISGVMILDGKTKKRLDNRRVYRRLKRSRLRYRKPRFLNREKRSDWLPPSIERRYQTHIRLINRLKQFIPISKIIIETAKFDIQKLKNPDIKGIEYQQGDLYQYQNVKSYLLSREQGKCEHCKKRFDKSNGSHIHHRIPGNNRLENLMLIHKKCHDVIHKNPKLLKKYQKPNIKTYKPSTFMNIINRRFVKDIQDLEVTYGYITDIKRREFSIEKSHSNDAFIISGGTIQKRTQPIEIIQKHRNNRILQRNRKGFKPSIRRRRYSIQPKDLVWVNGKMFVSNGTFNYGMNIYIKNSKFLPIKQIEKVFHFGSFVWQNMLN